MTRVRVTWADADDPYFVTDMPEVPRVGDQVWTPQYGPCRVLEVVWQPFSVLEIEHPTDLRHYTWTPTVWLEV